jgi:putative intracellular protease/amidase
MSKRKVIVVLSEWGYWGEELVGPLAAFDAAKYDVTFVTPRGRKPVALPPSMDPTFVDPPLGRSVTTPEVAKIVRDIEASTRLNNPLNLSQWFPDRPYPSSPNYLREMEAYYKQLDKLRREDVAGYDAILLVGGTGPMVDMANNFRVHDLILAFYDLGKPVAAECYGVTCLAFARNRESKMPIIRGKHVTGHPIDYDYKDGTGFMGVDFNMGPPPYPLEFILRDAVGPEGQFHGNVGRETSVIVDYPFITGRSTPDSFLTGEKVVAVLEERVTRFGW